jgi:hypothetical protein
MELLYHVPLSLWAVWGLLRGEFPSLSPSPLPEPHLPGWVGTCCISRRISY